MSGGGGGVLGRDSREFIMRRSSRSGSSGSCEKVGLDTISGISWPRRGGDAGGDCDEE
jgi:hypothetical protein